MPDVADIFRQYGPAYLEKHADDLLPSHQEAVERIIACRTSQMDGCVMKCTACGTEHFHTFSCGNRACPQCHEAKRYQWLEKRRAEILPGVTYFHVVFTLPAEYRGFARSHQKAFLPVLFDAAVKSMKKLAADPRHLGGDVGILAVLHTWTRTLEYHPHLHMLIPGIARMPDGAFKKKDSFLVPIGALGKIFRAKFISKLKRIFPERRALPYVPPKKKWNVFVKESSSHPDRVLNYFARYVYGQAIDNSRILDVNDDGVRFSYKRDGKRKEMTLKPDDFLRRYLQHTLPKGFHRVRFYGLWHASGRDQLNSLRLQLHHEVGEPAPPPPKPKCFPCPHCQQPMVVLRLVTSSSLSSRRPP